MNIYKMPDGDLELADFPAKKDIDWTIINWGFIQNCNLRCPYCVGKGWQNKSRTTLIDKLGITRLGDCFEKLSDTNSKKLYILFTGGEPTLAKNFTNLCNELIKRKFVISIQTNFVTNGAIDLVNRINPAGVGMIEAAYHGWILDKNKEMKRIYMSNFEKAIQRKITCVLKLVAIPTDIAALPNKIKKLNQEINNAPILIQSYIQGSLSNFGDLKRVYPYAYSLQQKKILTNVIRYRKNCHITYWRGAGLFNGMRCDAGRGFIYLDNVGTAYRCGPLGASKPNCLGNLTGGIKLRSTPERCPIRFCGCTQWGMWYGMNPWDYIPGTTKKSAYYCRFGPQAITT